LRTEGWLRFVLPTQAELGWGTRLNAHSAR
jgi:hypothetical protein